MSEYVYVVGDFCGGTSPVIGSLVGIFTDEKVAIRVRNEHNKKTNGGSIDYAWGSVEISKIKLNEASCVNPNDWCHCRD